MIDASALESTTVASTSDGKVIRVSAIAEPYVESRHGKVRLDGSVPRNVLKKVTVYVDGRDVSPPKSEYSGFGDPSIGEGFVPLSIQQDSQGLIYIYLSGGDRGGSHSRRFVVSTTSWIRTEYRGYFNFEYKAADQ